MSKLKELREQQNQIVVDARKYLDQMEGADEGRSGELQTSYDDAMKSFDKIEADIRNIEQMDKVEQRMKDRQEKANEQRKPDFGVNRSQHHEEKGGAEEEYRGAFYDLLRSGGDVSSLSSEHRALLRHGFMEDAEKRAQTAGTNSEGGFTVPTTLANLLIETMAMHGPMYDGTFTTEILTSGGGQIDIPTVDDTAVTAGAHTEGATLTDDGGKDVTFAQKVLGAYVYDTEWVKWSYELNQDSIFNMERLLNQLLGKRLARIANTLLTTGTGSGQPNGIATASSAGVTAAATAAITSDELIDLYHSVDPAYRQAGNVAYMMNDTTLAAIRKLKDGDGNYLWQMGDVKAGVPATLNGARVVVNQAVADMGASAKAVLFGDFSQYFVRKVGTPLLGVAREKFWPNLGIAGLVRFDGELGDTAAVKALVNAAV